MRGDDDMKNRLRNDGGWFGVISLLIVPAAILAIPLGILCFWLAGEL